MESIHGTKTGIALMSLPLLIALVVSASWEPDHRTDPTVARLLALKTSPWSWDKVEYARLLEMADVNELVEGRPLYVALGIQDRNKTLLQSMIRRGANLNSTEWGCTPLLMLLDNPAEAENGESASVEEMAAVLLRAGADPNLLPTEAAVSIRLNSVPERPICKAYDSTNKGERKSVLGIFMDRGQSETLVSLLIENGARPRDVQDARHIQQSASLDWKYKSIESALTQLTLKFGATLNDENPGSDLPLIRALTSTSSETPQEVARLVGLGADPNKRSRDGKLPLELALNDCVAVRRTSTAFLDALSTMKSYGEMEWSEADQQARGANGKARRTITALLEGGANPNLPMSLKGKGNLLAYAATRCSSDIADVLIEYGAKVTEAAVEAAQFGLRDRLNERLEH